MALDTITGTGAQGTTSSPQTVGGPSTNAASSGRVQPGTASNLLSSNATGSTGVSLSNQALTVVDLSKTSSATQSVTAPPAKPHHINGLALGLCVLLGIVAVVVFASISKSAKNTTY